MEAGGAARHKQPIVCRCHYRFDPAREVAANGLDPNTTVVENCMRTPVVTIEDGRPTIDAVRMMKEQGSRHLAVTQDGQIIGVVSVSNILRHYSGVA